MQSQEIKNDHEYLNRKFLENFLLTAKPRESSSNQGRLFEEKLRQIKKFLSYFRVNEKEKRERIIVVTLWEPLLLTQAESISRITERVRIHHDR